MGISIIINEPEVRYTNTAAYAASATYATYAKTSEYATYTFHALTADAALEADEADLAGEVPFDFCCIKPDIDQEPHVVEPPVFSPPQGHYDIAQFIQIATPTEGASIRYGPGGSIANTYTGGWTLGTDMSYSAQAYKVGWISSGVVTASYTFGAQPQPPGEQHIARYQVVDTCNATGVGNVFSEGSCIVNALSLTPSTGNVVSRGYSKSIVCSGGQGFNEIHPILQSVVNWAVLQGDVTYTGENDSNVYKYALNCDIPVTVDSISKFYPRNRYYIYSLGKFKEQQLYATRFPVWATGLVHETGTVGDNVGRPCKDGEGMIPIFWLYTGYQGEGVWTGNFLLSALTLSDTGYPWSDNETSYTGFFGGGGGPGNSWPRQPNSLWNMGAPQTLTMSFPRNLEDFNSNEFFDKAIKDDIATMNLHRDIREIKYNKKYIKADGHDYCELSIVTNNKETLWIINNKTYMIKNTDNVSKIIIKSNIRNTILINISDINIIYNSVTINFI